jgi:hypothetical protein
MFKAAAGLGAVVIILLVLFFVFRGDDEASAEERYDGVHLCSPSQQAVSTAEAGVRSPGPTRTASDEGPLFAQNSTTWGKEEYDHGVDQDIGCGATIEQCGCAMTSVATVLQLFQVLSTPEGVDLNPSTLNAWFNEGARETASGWVSRGYVYGNVVWTAINGWTPSTLPGGPGGQVVSTEIAPTADTVVQSPRGIRFKGWGSGSEDEIRRELQAGRPVVLEVPGHYIAAVGLQDNTILINDPFYADRTTLDAYAGRVKSARLFEPSEDMRSLMITVPANLRIEVKDERGRTVGTLGGKDPAAAEAEADTEIPGAVYKHEAAWRDPTCTERAPPDGAGTNTVFIPLPEKGIYTVEVIDPDGKRTSAGVYLSDAEGKHEMEVHEGGGRIVFEVDYDSEEPTQTTDPPTPTPTTAATATVTPRPPTAVPGQPTAIPTVAPTATVTPTASATPVPVQIISFDVTMHELNYQGACSITVTWEVSGPPDTVVYLYRADGDTVGTNPANRVFEAKVGKGSFTEPFKVGLRSYRLQANGSTGSALKAPITVAPICIQEFYTVDQCTEPYSVKWLILGNTPGARATLFRRETGTTQLAPVRTVNVTYGTRYTYNEDTDFSKSYDYILQVAVGSRLVTTPPITEKFTCVVG